MCNLTLSTNCAGARAKLQKRHQTQKLRCARTQFRKNMHSQSNSRCHHLPGNPVSRIHTAASCNILDIFRSHPSTIGAKSGKAHLSVVALLHLSVAQKNGSINPCWVNFAPLALRLQELFKRSGPKLLQTHMDAKFGYEFIVFCAMDGHSPYEFIGIGAMDGHSLYEFIGNGAMDAKFGYEFIGIGAMDGQACL